MATACDVVEVAANEYAKGARDLETFAKRMQKQFGGKVPDDVIQAAFTKAAQRYRTDYKALESVKREIADTIAHEAAQNRSLFVKVGDTVLNVVGAGRGLVASMDLSAPFRQGAFLFYANPIMGGKAFGTMLKAAASEEVANTIDAAIRTRPNAQLYEDSGLYISPLEGTPNLTGREEAFMTNLAEKIPGIGKGYRASERAYVTFLNKMRADSFDMFKELLEKANGRPMTDVEAKAMANFVNAATGRGDLGKLSNASEALSMAFFSPRFAASRLQLISGQPLVGGTAATRRLIARTYLQFGAAAVAMIGLAKLGGAHVTTDPRSSDFLKLRYGNTRVDLMAGLAQWATLAARMVTRQTTSTTGIVRPLNGTGMNKSRLDVATSFARGKAAPLPGTAMDLMAGKDVVGNSVTQGGLLTQGLGVIKPGGPAATADYVVSKNALPMTWADFPQVAKQNGVPTAVAQALGNFLGLSVNTFQTKSGGSSRSRSLIPSIPNVGPKMPRGPF